MDSESGFKSIGTINMWSISSFFGLLQSEVRALTHNTLDHYVIYAPEKLGLSQGRKYSHGIKKLKDRHNGPVTLNGN